MKEFIGLRAKPYSCLKDKNDEDKKAKGAKKCVIEKKIKVLKTVWKQLKLKLEQTI